MTKKTSTPLKTLKPQSSKPDFFILPFFFFFKPQNLELKELKISLSAYAYLELFSSFYFP